MNSICDKFFIRKISNFVTLCVVCALIVSEGLAVEPSQLPQEFAPLPPGDITLPRLMARVDALKTRLSEIDRGAISLALGCVPDADRVVPCMLPGIAEFKLSDLKNMPIDGMNGEKFLKLKAGGSLALDLLQDSTADLTSIDDAIKGLFDEEFRECLQDNSLDLEVLKNLKDDCLDSLHICYDSLFLELTYVAIEALDSGTTGRFLWREVGNQINDTIGIPNLNLYKENLLFVKDQVLPMLMMVNERVSAADKVSTYGALQSVDIRPWRSACDARLTKMIALRNGINARLGEN